MADVDTEKAAATEHEMPNVEPQEEHRWLQRLVGEWDYEHSWTDESGATQTARGSESVRSLGDLWVVCEGRGEMPGGGEAQMVMTLGFDPQKGHFVGTWVGSMMTHLWVYEGALNGGRLELRSEGPDMANPGGTAQYKDVIEWLADDHRTLTGNLQGPDGSWAPMMTAHYRRRR
jgi:hypothetical protein